MKSALFVSKSDSHERRSTNIFKISTSVTRTSPRSLTTNKGQTSYYTINEEVFKPNGFEIISASEPVPLLKNTKPKTCDQIFSSWLDIALEYVPPSYPAKSIPPELIPEFTMNGHAVLTQAYHNDMAKPMPKIWNQIPAWLNLDPLTLSSYGAGGISVLHSIKYMNVTGMNGIVIGSVDPWVEVISLQIGANSLLTVEYQRFELLYVFRNNNPQPFQLKNEDFTTTNPTTQDLFVLLKL
ncbi:hypothetical protein WR25_19908 [Diploscapter pachys]|uniref:Uncharacterized protein n=1 Tax=Diploscapter pachys TaxID=2018661 RepID=A0A2A2LXN5_9BILA|nr:hypothetical protein WR25_19908 [Diploscapter pachys]